MENIVQKIEKYVKRKMSGEATGHDWFHANRVRKMALFLARNEKTVDLKLIEIAALMHDLGDWKLNKNLDEEKILRKACHDLKMEKDLEREVIEIITNMSFSKNLSGKKTLRLEGQIVQDADRLDALGAIGIARAFAFGGRHQKELYNPQVKPVVFSSTEKYRSSKSTTINHFYEKLFLLKDSFNTKVAKEIAKKREKFMKEFLKEFYNEWEGKS